MNKLILYLIAVFRFSAHAIPCSDSPSDTRRCSVCTQWQAVIPGDFFCGDLPNMSDESFHDKSGCGPTAIVEYKCTEEEIFDKSALACSRVYVHKKTDTCDTIARKANIDIRFLKELNKKGICENLAEHADICINGYFDCPLSVTPGVNVKCNKFLEKNSITVESLKMFNPDVPCEPNPDVIPESAQPMKRHPLCLRDPCRVRLSVTPYQTCEMIAKKGRITMAHFFRNNPGVNCGKLKIGDSMCIWRNSDRLPIVENDELCAIMEVSETESCEQLATRYSNSFVEFMSSNPLLECDRISEYSVCLGTGFFEKEKCTDFITNSEFSCQPTIERLFDGNHRLFAKLNPKADCSFMELGRFICLRETAPADLIVIVNVLKNRSPTIQKALAEYSKDDSWKNEMDMLRAILNEMPNPYVGRRLEHHYKTSSETRVSVNLLTQHVDRKKACTQFKNSAVYAELPHITKCLCEEDSFLFYCGALLFVEIEKLRETGIVHKNKDTSLSTTGGCVLSASGTDTTHGGCALPGCKVDYSLFSLHIDSKLCRPRKLTTDCINKTACERTATEAEVRICSKHLLWQFSFGGDPCISISGRYYAALGVLRLNTVIFKAFLKIEARLSFKVHEMQHPRKCDTHAFRCEDYCVWRKENVWKMYGHITVSHDFGFFKLPIIDVLHTFPYDECSGNQAIVLFENKRSANLTIRCWSSDKNDQFIMDQISLRYHEKQEISFKVNPTTEVSCVLGDGVKGDIAIDVYGGYKGPLGRTLHRYTVKTTEITRYSEDQDAAETTGIVALWD